MPKASHYVSAVFAAAVAAAGFTSASAPKASAQSAAHAAPLSHASKTPVNTDAVEKTFKTQYSGSALDTLTSEMATLEAEQAAMLALRNYRAGHASLENVTLALEVLDMNKGLFTSVSDYIHDVLDHPHKYNEVELNGMIAVNATQIDATSRSLKSNTPKIELPPALMNTVPTSGKKPPASVKRPTSPQRKM